MKDPTVITGVGAVTPLGNEYRLIAENLLQGRSGIRTIAAFPTDDQPSRIAGVIEAPARPAGIPEPEWDECDDFQRLVLACAVNALRDAGIWERRDPLRIGIVLGTATEMNWFWETEQFRHGRPGVYDATERVPIVQWLQSKLGLNGPVLSLSAACASSNFALSMARSWLEMGWVDCCLAGGADLALTPMILAGFGNLRALSRRNDQPETASRPFDRDRDGFVLGEGGVLFLLEGRESANRRDGRVYGELAGFGAASDAHHMVIPSPHPEPAITAMNQALDQAKVNVDQVDYINAHATSTPVGDAAEARILHRVFGAHTPRIPVSSTKSMTGHLLTAAAAFEALACMIALEGQVIPPTINLENPDPECDLCHVPRQALERSVRIAVSNSFGFGGSNTSIVLRKVA